MPKTASWNLCSHVLPLKRLPVCALDRTGGALVPASDAGAIPGVTYRYGVPAGPQAVVATMVIRSNFTRNPIWNVVRVHRRL